MIKLQENTQTDGRTARMMDGRTGRRTDRPYLIGPFWLRLGVKKMYGCFSFLFIFHSVKLQLSDILWAHVEFWTYLGMPTHLMRNIGLDVLLFWLSVQIQSLRSIHSIWLRAFAFTSYNSGRRILTDMDKKTNVFWLQWRQFQC